MKFSENCQGSSEDSTGREIVRTFVKIGRLGSCSCISMEVPSLKIKRKIGKP